MPETPPSLFHQGARSSAVRLRTFVTLRWVAIGGQIATISVAALYFHLQLDLGLAFTVIGASFLANLAMMMIYPQTKRLSETEVTLMLLFDMSQLALLIFLTGGLNNPFALLILAPVTIAAAALHMRATVLVGLVAIALISLVGVYHLPLRNFQGLILQMPRLFVFGFWLAIVIGTAFLGFYARRVTAEIRTMSQALLATQMALAREQKLTDLGGVIAAAAHELGTPLATIKLVSTEMIEDIDTDSDLRDDAMLIRDQANRCREILRTMGRAGNDDLHLKYAPLAAVLEEAAAPHMDRGKTIQISVIPDPEAPGPKAAGRQPELRRQPEIIHGLRTLIQNAVDFAAANVWVEAKWTPAVISIRIMDDGDGFPPHLLGRIGDPFMRYRKSADDRTRRPEYEGMGLGLFIAKTLLERTGAKLRFDNCSDPFLSAEERPKRCGAVVQVTWPHDAIATRETDRRHGLGHNQPIQL